MKLTGLSVLAAAIGSVSAVNFRLYQNNANCDASAPGVVVKNYTNTLHNPCMSPGNNATFSMSLDYVNGPEYYVSLEAFSESDTNCNIANRIARLQQAGTCFSSSEPIGRVRLLVAVP